MQHTSLNNNNSTQHIHHSKYQLAVSYNKPHFSAVNQFSIDFVF